MRSLDRMVAGICEFNILLTSFCMQFWFVSLTPKYFNFVTFSKHLLNTVQLGMARDDNKVHASYKHIHHMWYLLRLQYNWFDKCASDICTLSVLLFIECMLLPTWRHQLALNCPIFIASCWFRISDGYSTKFVIMLKNRKSFNWYHVAVCYKWHSNGCSMCFVTWKLSYFLVCTKS